MTLEEAIQTLQANAELLHFEHPHLGLKEAIEVAIEALSKPSPPSDLDEVAEKRARYIFESLEKHDIGEEKNRVLFGLLELEALALSFSHFGAEWMAEQGETIEGEVVKDINNNLVVIAKGFSRKNAVFGDKVTVQIRKK